MVRIVEYQELIEKDETRVDDILIAAATEAYPMHAHPYITLKDTGDSFHYLGPDNAVLRILVTDESRKAEIHVEPLKDYIKKYVKSYDDFLESLKRGITTIGIAGKTGLKARDLQEVLDEIESGKTKFKKVVKRRY